MTRYTQVVLTTCVFWHLPRPQHLETSQGISVDSLGGSAIEIRHIFTPDHHRHCQEVPKCILATLAAFLLFVVHSLQSGGVWGPLCSFQVLRCDWGALNIPLHFPLFPT